MGKKQKQSFPLWYLLPIVGAVLGIWLAMPRARSVSFDDIREILPDSTEVALTIDVKTQSWSFLDKLVSPQAKEVALIPLNESPLFNLLRQTGMDWQRDVKPWSQGIVGAALLGNKEDASKATVLIAPSKNRGGREFLARYRRALGNFKEQTYEGVSYYQLEGSTDVTAEVKNYVIIATHPQALFQIIDVFQNRRKSLRSLSLFTPDQNDRSLVEGIIRGSNNLFDQTTKEPEALTFTLSSLSDGFDVNVKTIFRNPLPVIPDRGSQLIGLLPGDTFLVLSGRQLGESWSYLEQSFGDNLKPVRSAIEENSPFNLEQDIFSWMTGEFTIGAIPAKEGILTKTAGFGLVFLAEADQQRSSLFFAQLDQLAANSEGGILPRGVTLQPQGGGVLWLVGKSVAASHGVVNQAVFWAMGELGSSLNSSPKLSDSPKFQGITKGLKAENGGYFYLDMTPARTIFSQNIAPEDWRSEVWFQNTMTILASIEGIAFTQSQANNRTTNLQGKIILRKPS